MSKYLSALALVCGLATTGTLRAGGNLAATNGVRVGDAYAIVDGQRWRIGTGFVELALECKDGNFRLASCKNKLTNPPTEYVTEKEAISPVAAGGRAYVEKFAVERVWGKPFLRRTAPVDPATDKLRVAVKKGEMLGFAEGPHGSYEGDQILWPITIDYGDGRSYSSVDDTKLDQGPIWFYYVRLRGSGFMELIDSIDSIPNVTEQGRIPSQTSKFRAPGTTPHIGPSVMHPTNTFDAVRVWKAPQDGTVSIRGPAKHIGGGDVDLEILRIHETSPRSVGVGGGGWVLEEGRTMEIRTGGRPAVQLALTLKWQDLRIRYHVVAYPGTPILRMWSEFENTAAQPSTMGRPDPFSIALRSDEASCFTHCWMVGGNNKKNAGEMQSATVGTPYHSTLGGHGTYEFVPWTCLLRTAGARDGWFTTLDFLGAWNLSVSHENAGPVVVSWEVLEMLGKTLQPGQQFQTPLVTIGVFAGGLDGMARRVYDWQYEYLWDYTNTDFLGRPMWLSAWFFCSRNLQEQFTARLAGLDMDADLMRSLGFEMLWDDAGWSKHPKWPIANSYSVVFTHSYEGPDYAQTLRYLHKMGMQWLLWFCGNPPPGVLDGKVGAWGSFQWRTDAVWIKDLAADRGWRELVEHFLTANPRSSYHTCSGGGTYAHTFEIQRYADVNYLSDGGRGDATNHCFSYLDLPDKWVDIIETYKGPHGRYKAETSRQLLTMVPFWCAPAVNSDLEALRRDVDLYHYLLRQRVAGRWSHMFHPTVKGDQEIYYAQRTSYDGTKALIVLKHKAAGVVTILPHGLLPEHGYEVGFDSTRATATRTGADLMAHGIVIKDQAPGELVYLGLPDRPGAGRDHVAPTAPGRVLTRREMNLGHSGIGIHWSPGADNKWISYYEVRRGETMIGRAATGTFCFDHLPGWDAKARYSVRTVDGDGNASPWTVAQPVAGEPASYSALGGHFSARGRDGWSAETTSDCQTFEPMKWVPPAKNPAADFGGTPNQSGGVEGYWEGPGSARVGRGWQQASKTVECVRTWTAPMPGKVRIIGRVMKEYYRQAMGGPLQVKILHNGRQIWPKDAWGIVPRDDLVGVTHDLALDVAAEDAIQFVLGRGASPDADVIAWMPRIVYAEDHPAREQPTVVRILCGATQPYTDNSGNVWSADRFFAGGQSLANKVSVDHALPTLADQPLYQHGRSGKQFTYSIPLRPGLYCLRLKFAEPEFEHYFERPLNLSVNGRQVLTNFDICHAARGPRIAHERVFRYLVPDENGLLVLRFTGGWEPQARAAEAMVQAIEILPETKSVVRIDCGSKTDFVDWNSSIWHADEHFAGGQSLRTESPVTQASPTLYDQALYQTARSGRSFAYNLPVSPGLYVVHLKFAECWLKEPGKRPMNIEINGRPVRMEWDPASAAGQLGMAADFRAEDITPDKDGLIAVRVAAAGTNDAILQSIEVE